MAPGPRGARTFVFVYTLSGAAGLVYEVTWARLLSLHLGHTVAAASVVLAAFMGGLAIGASVAGQRRAVDSAANLRLYGALELGVAVAAVLLPFLLSAAEPALAWAYADGTAATRFTLVRLAISIVLVGIPAAAMGATFPVSVAATGAVSSVSAATLYAANTAGAAVGAIASGFWLIPALGLRGTTWVGVVLNVAAAAGAFVLATAQKQPPAEEPVRPPHKQQKARTKGPVSIPEAVASSPMVANVAAAVSGFSALVYEVAWTRLLALVIGPTTYAFATMAASFISGLAIGSALGARMSRRTNRPALWLGFLLAGGAAAATVAAWYAATAMPLAVAAQVADTNADFTTIVWRQAFEVSLLLLPMTLALGASFPLALALSGAGRDVGTAAGDAARVYAANTWGSIGGSLAAGFLLIPALGLRNSIRLAALVAALCGAAVIMVARRSAPSHRGGLQPKALPFAAAAAAVVTILVTPSWDRALLASGAYKYAPYLSGTDLDGVLRAGHIVYYKEGATGTVTVKDLTGIRSLAIDGKVDASNAGDMLTQRLLGLLPMLLHGRAEDVAVIGLGSGVTVGSALAAGTARRTDVIEISPEVVEASHFFDKENSAALSQPGVRLIVGDGRSHLLLSPRKYDVIVSEPSNPWMAGVASLFTREFFEAARGRLKPNGLLCQWAHTYDIATADLRSIVGTFASVFPEGTLWLVGGGDLLLIGTRDGRIEPRLAALAAPGRTSILADVGIAEGSSSFALLSLFAGGPSDIARFASDAAIQSDDRTALEYSAPRGIYGRTKEDNAAAIRALQPTQPAAVKNAFAAATDADWTSRGVMDLRAQAFATAYDAFREAVSRNRRNRDALSGLSDAAGGASRLTEERAFLQEIAAREPANAEVRIELSRVLAVTGDGPGAVQAAADALERAPDDPRAAEQLASVLADTGDAQRLGPYAEAMAKRFPDLAEAQYYRATALFMSGQTQDAVTAVRQVVTAHPDHARAQGLLAAACASLSQRDCAESAFDASIRANPRDPSAYINAGAFRLRVADPARAAEYFAAALAIDPSSAAARSGLAAARSLLNR